jgi:hypothetical protein
MKQIMSLMYVDNLQLCSYNYFFMSQDFLYFVYKFNNVEQLKDDTQVSKSIRRQKAQCKKESASNLIKKSSFNSLAEQRPHKMNLLFSTKQGKQDSNTESLLMSSQLSSSFQLKNQVKTLQTKQQQVVRPSYRHFCPKTLEQALFISSDSLSLKKIAFLCKKLLLTLQLLHSKEVTHMGLNMKNVLLVPDSQDNLFRDEEDHNADTPGQHLFLINIC